jgi:hypothetical protein
MRCGDGARACGAVSLAFLATLGVLLLDRRGADARVLFSEGIRFGQDAAPRNATSADLDGDGTPDLLVAGVSGIGVYLGMGDGRFAVTSSILAGANASVVVGDVDGDLISDVITRPSGADDATVFLGSGDGTFSIGPSFAVPGHVLELVDLDGQLGLDLIAGTDVSVAELQVFLGNGDATFQGLTPFAADDLGIAVGDLDGDTVPDIVDASGPNALVRLGNGDGTFAAPVPYPAVSFPDRARALLLADADGDTDLDLLVRIIPEHPVLYSGLAVLLGNGDGTLGAATELAGVLNPVGVAVERFDDDSHPDILYAGCCSAAVVGLKLLSGNGDGSFGLPATIAPNFAPSPGLGAVADLDGDTEHDVVELSGDAVHTLLSNGDGTFEDPEFVIRLGVEASDIAVADLDGEMGPELIVADRENGDLSVFVDNGDGTYEANVYPSRGDHNSLVVADFDEDTHLDVVTAEDGNEVDQFLGNGDGTLQWFGSFPSTNRPSAIAVGLIDSGNTLPDIVVTNSATNDLRILLGKTGGGFLPAAYFDAGDNPMGVAVGRLDANSSVDIVTAAREGHAMAVLLADGHVSFGSPALLPVGTGPVDVLLEDLDGDGVLDALVANAFSGDLTVLLGNGDGTFEEEGRWPVRIGSSGLACADFDRDGNLDVAVANTVDRSIAVLLGRGNGRFLSADHYALGLRLQTAVAAADVNGDTLPDLVIGGGEGIQVLINAPEASISVMAATALATLIVLRRRG